MYHGCAHSIMNPHVSPFSKSQINQKLPINPLLIKLRPVSAVGSSSRSSIVNWTALEDEEKWRRMYSLSLSKNGCLKLERRDYSLANGRTLFFFCSGEARDSPAPSLKKSPPPAAAPTSPTTSSPNVKPPVFAQSPLIVNSPPSEAPASLKNGAFSNRLALTGYLTVGIVAAAFVG